MRRGLSWLAAAGGKRPGWTGTMMIWLAVAGAVVVAVIEGWEDRPAAE